MADWSLVREHVAAEITLLCDTHHREKTNGLLPVEQVRAANETPYNLREEVSKPYDLHYNGTECEAIIGSNHFTMRDQGNGMFMMALVIDGNVMLGFALQEGHLFLNLLVLDELNETVLRIHNNQLIYSSSPWDIQLVGRNLVIREAPRQFIIDITFEVPNKIVINRGRFLCNGVEVFIRPEYTFLVNNSMLYRRNVAINCPVGLLIGSHPPEIGAAVGISGVNRYRYDRREAFRWARRQLKQN